MLKFAGFDSIEEAKELVGYDLAIPADERIELPSDSFYEWELIGCRVETIGGQKVGEVKGSCAPAASRLLSVVDESGRDRLIPMAGDIVVRSIKRRN